MLEEKVWLSRKGRGELGIGNPKIKQVQKFKYLSIVLTEDEKWTTKIWTLPRLSKNKIVKTKHNTIDGEKYVGKKNTESSWEFHETALIIKC